MSKKPTQELVKQRAIADLKIQGITKINGDGKSDPPLIRAINSGDTELFEALLCAECKLDVIELGRERIPALNLAIIKGRHDFVTKLLLAGADMNGRDGIGNTPLMTAVSLGYVNTARNLVEKSVDTSAQNNLGETALMFAAKEGNLNLVNIILNKSRGSIDLCTNQGKTALMIAEERGKKVVAAAIASHKRLSAPSDLTQSSSSSEVAGGGLREQPFASSAPCGFVGLGPKTEVSDPNGDKVSGTKVSVSKF